jgi:hypothetical protein
MHAGKHHGLWLVTFPLIGKKTLPLIQAWPGFALNTLFYVALRWGLWQVPMQLRRHHRAKYNRCPRYGYDLAGIAADALCPERNEWATR